MVDEIEAPRELMELAALRLTPKTDRRLQDLMDRNNDGRLNPDEREALEALAEMSETLSLVRAKALRCMGEKSA